jgi:hypothetical protein
MLQLCNAIKKIQIPDSRIVAEFGCSSRGALGGLWPLYSLSTKLLLSLALYSIRLCLTFARSSKKSSLFLLLLEGSTAASCSHAHALQASPYYSSSSSPSSSSPPNACRTRKRALKPPPISTSSRQRLPFATSSRPTTRHGELPRS